MRGASTYTLDKKPVPVEILLGDGRVMKGRAWITTGKSVAEGLNGPQAFLEVTPYGDERMHYISKTQILSLATMDIPNPVVLYERRGAVDANDPCHILEISAKADWQMVRSAYLRLSKAYHPDRFASVDLPPEITEYLSAKTSRINAAYALLAHSLSNGNSGVTADKAAAKT